MTLKRKCMFDLAQGSMCSSHVNTARQDSSNKEMWERPVLPNPFPRVSGAARPRMRAERESHEARMPFTRYAYVAFGTPEDCAQPARMQHTYVRAPLFTKVPRERLRISGLIRQDVLTTLKNPTEGKRLRGGGNPCWRDHQLLPNNATR